MISRTEFEAFHSGDWDSYSSAVKLREAAERRRARWGAVWGNLRDATVIVAVAFAVILGFAYIERLLPSSAAVDLAVTRMHAETARTELVEICSEALERGVSVDIASRCEVVLTEAVEDARLETETAFSEKLRRLEGMLDRFEASRATAKDLPGSI